LVYASFLVALTSLEFVAYPAVKTALVLARKSRPDRRFIVLLVAELAALLDPSARNLMLTVYEANVRRHGDKIDLRFACAAS
jgi:hypothetical protein